MYDWLELQPKVRLPLLINTYYAYSNKLACCVAIRWSYIAILKEASLSALWTSFISTTRTTHTFAT